MKDKIIAGSITAALLLTPAAALAQEPLQDPGVNQPGINQPFNQDQMNEGAPGGTTQGVQEDGFNAWWLLPLIAIIAAIPFLMRGMRSDKSKRETVYDTERTNAAYHDLERDRKRV